MALLSSAVCMLFLAISSVQSNYTITIYPEYLIQGGKLNFDPDRWNGKIGLDTSHRIPLVKKTGARTGRWIHPDLDFFEKMPEDPHRKGYPDPAFFNNKTFQQQMVAKYLDNLNQYGKDRPIMLELKGKNWPKWMDTSSFKGHLPNNLDAAAEAISLTVQAINDGTNGQVPPYFEPINEVNTFWSYANWSTMVEVFRLVATKLKTRMPKLTLGGPAWSGGLTFLDKGDFHHWHQVTEFMDMSLGLYDFFSFHPFNHLHVQGDKHYFYGPNEARLVGTVDMVETYANLKTGKDTPIIFSAHGFTDVTGSKVNKSSPFIDWANINQHNANIFTFLQLRSVVDRGISFLLSHTGSNNQDDINYSILDTKNKETNIALAYHLWQNLTSTMKFLRSESHFIQAERKVQSHVLVEPTIKTVTVLLHNFDTSPAKVKMNFDKGWISAKSAKSSCLVLNSQKVPQITHQEHIPITGGYVTVPSEATCFFELDSSHNFVHTHSIHERIRYGNAYQVVIKNKAAHMSIALHSNDIQALKSARLRISVSFNAHSANPVPTSVRMNGHNLSSFYTLHNPGIQEAQTLWATIEYNVPVSVPGAYANNIQMTFAQNGGRVAAIALVLRNQSH